MHRQAGHRHQLPHRGAGALIDQSGLLPAGALQLVIGGTGDLLDKLDGQDVVTFTGSADTAAKLRVHPNIVKHSIPFNAEADSLNCAILAPDVTPDDEEFDLFVKEVAREMTVKAGQKCTAIRRAIVPRQHLDAVADKLRARLAKTVVGDPANESVRMGALASHAQAKDVAERVAELTQRRRDRVSAPRTASPRSATAWPKARSSRPRCCWPRTPPTTPRTTWRRSAR